MASLRCFDPHSAFWGPCCSWFAGLICLPADDGQRATVWASSIKPFLSKAKKTHRSLCDIFPHCMESLILCRALRWTGKAPLTVQHWLRYSDPCIRPAHVCKFPRYPHTGAWIEASDTKKWQLQYCCATWPLMSSITHWHDKLVHAAVSSLSCRQFEFGVSITFESSTACKKAPAFLHLSTCGAL